MNKLLEWFGIVWFCLVFLLAMVSPFAALYAMVYWWLK